MTDNSFETCLKSLSFGISSRLSLVTPDLKNRIQEIRIRNGMPLAITVKGKTLFVLNDGQTSFNANNAYVCSKKDIDESYSMITNRSVYAHSEEIKEGFIRMPCGCRAGISGSFSDTGMIFDISGINLRIAKEYIGCADSIFNELDAGGVLISGPPGSGKTTILRDLIRQISNAGKRVSVIDSRGEISASYSGKPFYDLGLNTDTYILSDKAWGIVAALRTMFPEVIAFDEIGTTEELESVLDGFNAGVDIITTAHAGSVEEIRSRRVVSGLIASGAVKNVFLLSKSIGEKPVKIDKKEVFQ